MFEEWKDGATTLATVAITVLGAAGTGLVVAGLIQVGLGLDLGGSWAKIGAGLAVVLIAPLVIGRQMPQRAAALPQSTAESDSH